MPTSQVRQRGVTLIELMVTLVVLAILLAIAVPSFEGTIASSRLATTTNNLLGTLSQARMEAIRRGTRVTVCMSADGAQCATAGDWSQGWISFIDTPGNSAHVDAGDTIIGSGRAAPNGITLTGTGNVAQYISFRADGRGWTLEATPVAQTGTIRICSKSTALGNDNRTRDLSLIASGLINRKTTAGVNNSCPAP